MKTINKILFMAGFAFFLFWPFEGMSQYGNTDFLLQKQLKEARNNVCYERFNEAVSQYAVLVKSNDNKTVSAEYAYALALSGCYEGAIMNLDKIIASGQADNEVLFYASQVLKLMEYDTVADMFLMSGKTPMVFPPSWLLGQYRSFVEKYKYPATINTDDFGTALQRANRSAEKHQYIQSLVLFLELIEVYPDEYLPYIGLSALLENLGYKKEAAKYLQKGIKKMGKDKYRIDPSGVYEKHLETLQSSNDNDHLVFQNPKSDNSNFKASRRFTHYGISYINKAWAVNWKYGYYSSGASCFTIGWSFYEYEKTKTYSIDMSLIGKAGAFVGGVNLSGQLSGGKFGLGVGPCAGFAIPLLDGRSSIDIYGVINIYLQEEIGVGSSASIGYTRYF